MKSLLPHKLLIINVVIIILIIIEVLFIIPPNLKTVQKIQASIQEQFEEVNRQLILGQTAKKITKELDKIKPFLETLTTIFLKRDNQLEFITTLEAVAVKNNVKVKIVLPDIPTSDKDEDTFQVPLSLTLTGSYSDTIQFLIELQNLRYYINIVDISMNSQKNQTKKSRILTNLRANTYWKNK